MLNPDSVIIKDQIELTALGNLDTIPIKIIIETPLPIPLLVIWSPSHISNAVPAISPVTTNTPDNIPESTNIPCA